MGTTAADIKELVRNLETKQEAVAQAEEGVRTANADLSRAEGVLSNAQGEVRQAESDLAKASNDSTLNSFVNSLSPALKVLLAERLGAKMK